MKMNFDSLILVLCVITSAAGESLNCLTVYKEGGATAVFRSPKCPRWTISSFRWPFESPPGTCQTAMLKGRRKTQEDRALCAFDLRIPFLGPKGVKEVKVGILAIFDGHNGSEASEMASATLFQYFVLHTYFLLDTTYSTLFKKLVRRLPNKGEDAPDFLKLDWNDDLDRQFLNHGRFKVTLSSIVDGSLPFELLREALLRSIHDIDAAFSEDASRCNLNSGTTAAVVLLADTQILVANVGDSKAFLCTEVYQSPSEAKATVSRLVRQQRSSGVSASLMEYRQLKSMASDGWKFLVAKELTNDHRPDRDDEKSRVESAGGRISNWAGVARVNGQLAVSRSIGDVQFKSFGVIPVPEVTDWRPLTANDSFVIAASDGVFEKLSPQDICDVLWEPLSNFTRRQKHNSSCLFSSAECIVDAAFYEGSMDNLAVTMIPVRRGSFVGNSEHTYLAAEINSTSFNSSADGKTSVLPRLHTHPGVPNLDRLLVEGKYSNFGCFYLSENLDVNDGYTFWVHKDDQESVLDLSPALSGVDHFSWSRPLDVYNDQKSCLHFGLYINEDEDRCIYSDGFARFLGLLESIPFHNTGQNERETLGTRYILKKKFDRGAFGEVWLAFNWNCTQVAKDLQKMNSGNDYSHRNEHLGEDGGDAATNIHANDCNASYSDGNMFILKRIMVERGIAAYLSGLREKYFGELFLNVSNSLKVSSFSEDIDCFCQMPGISDHCFKNTSESVGYVIEEPFITEDMSLKESRRHEDASHEEGLSHIARYVESFESQSNEIWLVFHHEGVSLSKLLYTAEEVVTVTDEQRSEHANRVKILRPSNWWHWLKTTEAGQEEFRNIIWQLLIGLKACHARGITHRDIKPENMLICFQDEDSRGCLRGIPDNNKNYTITMRIIDFGSAVDDFTMKHLYGSAGPSSAEQTSDYAPPEALLNASWYQGPASVSTKYDMWSTGVVILELILGSPHVFQINSKTQALLEHHLQGWSESLKELAYKLRALMEMCILFSGISSETHKNDQGSSPPVPWKCSEEHFSHLIKSRDPLKLGFPNKWALRLVRDLLQWDPGKRFSVDDALKHPYFSRAS